MIIDKLFSVHRYRIDLIKNQTEAFVCRTAIFVSVTEGFGFKTGPYGYKNPLVPVEIWFMDSIKSFFIIFVTS